MEKRVYVLIMLGLMSLVFLPVIYAELEISKNPVIDAVVPEVNLPGIYDLKIRNLGESDSFKIYSLVGVDIYPNESFDLARKETKEIRVEIWPQQSVLDKPGTFNFVYKIKSSSGEIQDDVMLIRIVNLRDALEINSYNINLDSDKALVYVRNKISLPFPEIKANFKSDFFDFSKTFSLDKYEKKEFEIFLDKEKIKKLTAGSYIISTNIETFNVKEKIVDSFRFSEKEEIKTEEIRTGFFISKLEIKKINEGNLATLTQVNIKKNIISRLFTSFNYEPVKVERDRFSILYSFQKEVSPGEVFAVKATTNWLYPLILIIAIIMIIYLVKAYTYTFLVLKKRASFIKTKGGEFALKITITARARDYIEKIKIIDKIPSLVKVHEKFGLNEPDKIDEKNRRLEWNIESLQPEEERVFSYIIYSKISPIGRFEIPSASSIFEKEGKIHESISNRVFFMTEPRKASE